MKVFIKYPYTKESQNIFLNNLAKFKAKLILKSIDSLKITDNNKDKVIEKVLDILNDMPNGSII